MSQNRKHPLRAVSFALLLAGCGARDAEHVGVAADAIAGGEISETDAAVVGMVAQDQLYCTGTLVAGHVVLTAGHCLPPDIPVDPSEIKVFVGTSWAEGGWIIDATDVWVHPQHLEGAVWKDVGLVALQHAPAQPIPLRTTLPAEGEAVRIVGFGRVDPDNESDDTKRSGTASISSVLVSGLILSADPSAVCGGDSGGPGFVNDGGVERIATIHSRGTCEFEMTEMRADQFVAEVESFIAAHPPPTCEADDRCAINCATTDPDCPVADPPDDEPQETTGCAMAGGTGRAPWLAMLILGLAAARRRASRTAMKDMQPYVLGSAGDRQESV